MVRSLRQFGGRRWGWHTVPLRDELAHGTVEEHRKHRLEEARRHLREVDPDALQDDLDGHASRTTAGTQ